MFLDARELPDNDVIACDICIVGAGAAGIAMARQLAGTSLRVVVLESGGFDFDEEAQDLYKGAASESYDDPLDAARLRYFGGSTNHWAGYCRMLDEIDFKPRPAVPRGGWPFSRADLIPYYRRAHPVCGLGEFDDDATKRAEINEEALFDFDPARLVPGLYHVSAPLRFGQAYREELSAPDGIQIHLNANVVDIETDDGARHVDALAVACLTGTGYRVRPKVAVLAAGGIENVRLLLNADNVQAGGLGNGSDLVGRYFMDHPLVFRTAELVPADPGLGAAIYGDFVDARGTVRAVTTMPASLLEREALPNVVMTWSVERDFAPGVHSASKIYRSLSDGTLPDELGTHLGRIIGDMDDVVMTAYRKAVGIPAPVRSMTAHCRIEPVPDRESRVTLLSERDPLGLRRVRLDWWPNSAGVRALQRIHELAALEVGRIGLGRLRIDIPMEGEDWPPWMAPSDHHIGTTRMDDDPSRGVVDRNCRIHGVDNLYVAGSSVYPSAGPNNPTLTVVALALRLADHVQERLIG